MKTKLLFTLSLAMFAVELALADLPSAVAGTAPGANTIRSTPVYDGDSSKDEGSSSDGGC